MKRILNTALAGLLSCLVFAANSEAPLVITPMLPADEIVEGTASLDFTLNFSGTGLDAAALIDAFTYAVGTSNSRAGADPAFVKPVAVANLATALASWQLFDQSSMGAAPNQVAGNANAPQGTSIGVPSEVLTFTLDTSGLAVGDVVTIRPDLFIDAVAAVSFQGAEFDLERVESSFLVISATAIPEPASFAFLGLASGLIAIRRRR